MRFEVLFCFVIINIVSCYASAGDKSLTFHDCLKNCRRSNCTDSFYDKQPKYLQLLGWDCVEECKYECMWKTVEYFQKLGEDLPQFYGKWPFIRIAGMQEPASVVFSVLNGAANVIGYFKYYYGIPSSTPMHNMVIVHLVISINTWTWSAVFHWRDLPWTEKLDYFCATTLGIYILYFFWYRLSLLVFSKKRLLIQYASLLLLLSAYISHVTYLSVVKFDYRYNLIFNIIIGCLYSVLMLGMYGYFRKTLPHLWKPFVTVLLIGIFVNFEIFDFSPILWVFDSHSIWHFLTIPLPLLFFSFAKDDALYLQEQTQRVEVSVDNV